MTGGEERGGGFCRRLQEPGQNIKNVNRNLKLRPIHEMEGEACTGGGKGRCPGTGEERRGLYRRWCEACTGGGKESPLSVLHRERNWIGSGRTGEHKNSKWFF
jgi:hypothetical protein